MAPVSRLGRGSGSCPRCEQFGRTCPSCTQRRRVAWRLVDQHGHTIDQAAATLGLPPARVRELVEGERDRQELEKYRLDSIPVTRTRAFLELELERDP
jgi:hypothetical protein